MENRKYSQEELEKLYEIEVEKILNSPHKEYPKGESKKRRSENSLKLKVSKPLLFTHSEEDIYIIVETVLNKAKSRLVELAMEESSKDLMSQENASKFLKISIPTIIEWRNNKDLPHYNFNGRYYYSKQELLDYGKKAGK
ncbi:hypothetical protein CMT22_00165 [Elizabethkingia anophelis]|nr:hypothetical protein [Elizabethkingia anophelis]MDV4095660.1 hypothetical protein [Elizabethkingia anophelis]HAY3591751.1 helix-turn-helix domain-containing protein [Elizabethkingia anophelis]